MVSVVLLAILAIVALCASSVPAHKGGKNSYRGVVCKHGACAVPANYKPKDRNPKCFRYLKGSGHKKGQQPRKCRKTHKHHKKPKKHKHDSHAPEEPVASCPGCGAQETPAEESPGCVDCGLLLCELAQNSCSLTVTQPWVIYPSVKGPEQITACSRISGLAGGEVTVKFHARIKFFDSAFYDGSVDDEEVYCAYYEENHREVVEAYAGSFDSWTEEVWVTVEEINGESASRFAESERTMFYVEPSEWPPYPGSPEY